MNERFIFSTFLALQKESQVISRNDIIYTGFHMQLRSWKLKLQPNVMSYPDKRHVTHHPASARILKCLSLPHTHTNTHTHFTSNTGHTTAIGSHFFSFNRLQCPMHLWWVQLHYTRFMIALISQHNYAEPKINWMKRIVQTTKTFR